MRRIAVAVGAVDAILISDQQQRCGKSRNLRSPVGVMDVRADDIEELSMMREHFYVGQIVVRSERKDKRKSVEQSRVGQDASENDFHALEEYLA
jgi:hypothetical protein